MGNWKIENRGSVKQTSMGWVFLIIGNQRYTLLTRIFKKTAFIFNVCIPNV